jgi:hypothetical protein
MVMNQRTVIITQMKKCNSYQKKGELEDFKVGLKVPGKLSAKNELRGWSVTGSNKIYER